MMKLASVLFLKAPVLLAANIQQYSVLEHDYGYFSQPNITSPTGIEKFIKELDYLIPIDPNEDDLKFEKEPTMAYSFKELRSYFEMRYKGNGDIQKNSQGQTEFVDHGIWGGAKLYNKKRKSYNTNLDFSRIVCLSIAQHNVFKSQKIKKDEDYQKMGLWRLTSNSDFKIGYDTPLLLFLGLVDTLECVKKFSKSGIDGKGPYLQTKTVLEHIEFEIDEDARVLKWDLEKLAEHISERNEEQKTYFEELFKSYEENILNLEKWTVFKVAQDGNVFSIKY